MIFPEPSAGASVSADTAEVWIVAYAYTKWSEDPKKRKPVDNDTEITFSIVEGNGGKLLLSENDPDPQPAKVAKTFNGDGGALVILKTGRTPYQDFVVSASWNGLTENCGPVTIFSGLTDADNTEATVQQEFYPADGATIVDVTFTVRDLYGSLVREWTDSGNRKHEVPVSWTTGGLGELIDASENISPTGQVSASVLIGQLGEEFKLTLHVDEVSKTANIKVLPIAVQLDADKGSLDVSTGESAVVTATFLAPDPNNPSNYIPVANGTQVHWFSSNGSIFGSSTTTNGVAQATLNSAGGRVGNCVVAASIGGYGSSIAVEFVTSASHYIRDLVTELEIHGDTGETVSFTVDEQVSVYAKYPFDKVEAGMTPDVVGGNDASVHGATLDQDHSAGGTASLFFDGDDFVEAQSDSANQIAQGFEVKFEVLVGNLNNSTLVEKAGEYKVVIRNGGKAAFVVSGSTGQVDVESADSIPTDAWVTIRAFIKGGKIGLAINSDIVDAIMGVVLNPGSSSLNIGNSAGHNSGFTGNIDEFEILKSGLVIISQNPVTIGSSGYVTVSISKPADLPDWGVQGGEVQALFSNSGLVEKVRLGFLGDSLEGEVDGATATFWSSAVALAKEMRKGLTLEAILKGIVDGDRVAYISYEVGRWTAGEEVDWKSIGQHSLIVAVNLFNPTSKLGNLAIIMGSVALDFLAPIPPNLIASGNSALKVPPASGGAPLGKLLLQKWKRGAFADDIEQEAAKIEKSMKAFSGHPISNALRAVELGAADLMRLERIASKFDNVQTMRKFITRLDEIAAARGSLGVRATIATFDELAVEAADLGRFRFIFDEIDGPLPMKRLARLVENGFETGAKKGMTPRAMARIMNNSHLYKEQFRANFQRPQLLRSLDSLDIVSGYSRFVGGLKTTKNQNKSVGTLFELLTAEAKVPHTGKPPPPSALGQSFDWEYPVGNKNTRPTDADVDVLTDTEKQLFQCKASEAAFAGNRDKTEAYFKAAAKHAESTGQTVVLIVPEVVEKNFSDSTRELLKRLKSINNQNLELKVLKKNGQIADRNI